MIKYGDTFYDGHKALNTICSEVKLKKSKRLPLETKNIQTKKKKSKARFY